MTVSDAVSASVSTAIDGIVNTKIFYRDNKVTLIQSGIILLLPQITAFLLQYNKKEFGIEFVVQLENYPLLLFVFLVVMVYILIEPSVSEKTGAELSKIAFLSIHLFAFGLSVNLIYAILVPVLGFEYDPVAAQISNLYVNSKELLTEPKFAMLYGTPFLAIATCLVIFNSIRQYSKEQLVGVLKSGLFWRSFIVAVLLAFYQYAAFILVGVTA